MSSRRPNITDAVAIQDEQGAVRGGFVVEVHDDAVAPYVNVAALVPNVNQPVDYKEFHFHHYSLPETSAKGLRYCFIEELREFEAFLQEQGEKTREEGRGPIMKPIEDFKTGDPDHDSQLDQAGEEIRSDKKAEKKRRREQGL